MVNQEARAYKAWEILTSRAPNIRILTYEELAKALGTHPRAVRSVLGLIQDYCMDNSLPPLTILVVNKHTNLPGEGFTAWSHDNLPEGHDQVRSRDWTNDPNPFSYAADGTTSDQLVTEILTAPDATKEVYAKIKVRGVQRLVFRNALLRAYEGRCAVTGISLQGTLDAAHIVPWSQCSADLKMNPRNGILMLCCYHRLFDAGLMTINEDYSVVFSTESQKGINKDDQNFIDRIQGFNIRLPKDKSLWPDKDLIGQRNVQLDEVE